MSRAVEEVHRRRGTDIGLRDPFGNHIRIVQLAQQPQPVGAETAGASKAR